MSSQPVKPGSAGRVGVGGGSKFAHLVDVDPAEMWRRVDDEPGDVSDLLDAANRMAAVDGATDTLERAVIAELEERCGRA